jgi:hypothetical protein
VTVQNNGTIATITPGNRGQDYIRPPRVSLNVPSVTPAQFQAFLRVGAINLLAGGSYASTPIVSFIGGLPPAGRVIKAGCVRTIYLLDPGLGYPANTQVTIDGGGAASGVPTVQATATCTVDAFGRITSVTLTNMGKDYVTVPKVHFRPPAGSAEVKRAAKAGVAMAEGSPAQATAVRNVNPPHDITINLTDPGDGYIGVPDILITGGGGSGASAIARMELGRIDLLFAGKGYKPPPDLAPSVIFTPYFKQLFPDSTDQAAPFIRVFQSLFVVDAVTGIVSLAPVLS